MKINILLKIEINSTETYRIRIAKNKVIAENLAQHYILLEF